MNSKKRMKSQQQLSLEDVFCIACRCIYVRPVTMPCGHTICLECFKNMVNITAYQCPTCRRRISNWLRKYKHDWDSLINESLWEAVQQQYPVEVQKKLNDEDDGIEERIVCHDFTRVEMKEGEIKKEFDDMRIRFLQEQQEIELRSLELAKRLQEEEEAISQRRIVLNEELTQGDKRLASVIEEEFQEEYQQEQLLLNKSDMNLAKQLQDQISSEFVEASNDMGSKTFASKQKLPKKGPLDKLFFKSTLNPTDIKVQCKIKEKSLSTCTSTSSANTSSFQIPSTSSSLCLDQCTSSATDLPKEFGDENLDNCTCGRLQNGFNSMKPPCQFCVVQMSLLDKLLTQQTNDFLMAKDLEKQFRMKNFENYNLRKRPSPTQSATRKKIKKLSKGQQTLKQVLQENVNKF